MFKVISNASPLIGLYKINLLSILKDLWQEIIIPEAVYKEIVVDGAAKTGAKSIENLCKQWLKKEKNKNEVEALKTILDDGEAEVIALAQENKASLVLIDNKEVTDNNKKTFEYLWKIAKSPSKTHQEITRLDKNSL